MTDPKQALLNRGRDTRKLVAIPRYNQTLYFDITIKSLHDTAGLMKGAPAKAGNATAYRFQAGAGADALAENAAIRPGAEIDDPLFPRESFHPGIDRLTSGEDLLIRHNFFYKRDKLLYIIYSISYLLIKIFES